MTRAPLRFLLTVLALWVGARAAILLPDRSAVLAPAPVALAAPRLPPPPSRPAQPAPAPPRLATTGSAAIPGTQRQAPTFARSPQPPRHMGLHLSWSLPPSSSASPSPAAAAAPAFPLTAPAAPAWTWDGRWSASAWLLVREESGAALAPGGSLGGSQAGARLRYGLGSGLSLGGRVYLPLRRTAGAELAAGLDWRPMRALPVNLLAERRQRLGRDGRSAFALTLYGGTSLAPSPRLRLDVYGQAGVVGLRSRDLFADGMVRVSRRLGHIELGAGAWGAAQPGAARLDAGPSLSWRLPVPEANLRLQADWRFRIAGDAAPRSGPALTLAVDF
ncbi:MAG TPA: hypothetical protein VMG08_00925 [Allosphingosinicella sp.]|nr:hypothetical protein [Allosphingosinicella sp.]